MMHANSRGPFELGECLKTKVLCHVLTTVDWEIFVGKTFSSTSFPNEN